MTEIKTREFFSSVQTVLSQIVHAIFDNHDKVCEVLSYFKKIYTSIYFLPPAFFFTELG